MSADTPAPESIEEAREQAEAIRVDEPPARAKRVRKSRARKPGTAPRADAAPRGPRAPSLKTQLRDLITSVGAMLMLANAADGQAVIAGAAAQADALDALAKKNPAVRRALEGLLTASVYGQLIAAFAPTVLTIAANHGKVPPLVAGMVGAALQPTAAESASSSTGPTSSPADPFAGVDLDALAQMASSLMGGGDGVPLVGRVVGMD